MTSPSSSSAAVGGIAQSLPVATATRTARDCRIAGAVTTTRRARRAVLTLRFGGNAALAPRTWRRAVRAG